MDEQQKMRWLSEFGRSDCEIRQIEEEIAYWNSRAQRVTAVISALPGGGGKQDDPLQKAVEQMEALRELLGKRCQMLVRRHGQMAAAVGGLADEKLRGVLWMRYFEQLTWEEIGQRMGYEQRQIYRLHKKALGTVVIPTEGDAGCD